MAVIKLQLKKEHINLLKHLSWNELSKDKQISTSNLETDSPFGGFDYYEDMGIILYGKPDEFIPSHGVKNKKKRWTNYYLSYL